jgi:hypothetical protein
VEENRLAEYRFRALKKKLSSSPGDGGVVIVFART